MSQALEGMHYCVEHQGNHSHYASKNCLVCQLERELAAQKLRADENERDARRFDKLYEAARLLVLAWEGKPALAWQPDGHHSLLATLRRALAAGKGE